MRTGTLADKKTRLEELTEDFLTVLGRPVLTIQEATDLTGWGSTNLRNEIKNGLLIAARLHPAGDIRLSCRELARWYLSKERIERKGPKTRL